MLAGVFLCACLFEWNFLCSLILWTCRAQQKCSNLRSHGQGLRMLLHTLSYTFLLNTCNSDYTNRRKKCHFFALHWIIHVWMYGSVPDGALQYQQTHGDLHTAVSAPLLSHCSAGDPHVLCVSQGLTITSNLIHLDDHVIFWFNLAAMSVSLLLSLVLPGLCSPLRSPWFNHVLMVLAQRSGNSVCKYNRWENKWGSESVMVLGVEGCSFPFQPPPQWWGGTYDACSTAGSNAVIGQVGTVTYFVVCERWEGVVSVKDGSVLPRQYTVMWLKNLCPGCLKDLYTQCCGALL